MNVRVRLSPDETRSRILDVGEELFRRVGYAKTSVADIADTLEMSPANIYRFFPSKLAINEAICRRIMVEANALMDHVAAKHEVPPADRLLELILAHHDFSRAKLMSEKRVFDMVEVAMEESWDAILEHMQHVVAAIARIVAEGMATGAFRQVDPVETALGIKQACTVVIHPSLLCKCTQCESEATARRVLGLIIDGLSPVPASVSR